MAVYKTAIQTPNGQISINVRPFNSKESAQAECDRNNSFNSHLGYAYVIGYRKRID